MVLLRPIAVQDREDHVGAERSKFRHGGPIDDTFDHVVPARVAQGLRDLTAGHEAYLVLGIGAAHQYEYGRSSVSHVAGPSSLSPRRHRTISSSS